MVKSPEDSKFSMFPPYSVQITNEPDNLGAKIADAYYSAMKEQVKEKFLRLSHIAKLTKGHQNIVELYKKVNRDNLQQIKEEYVSYAVENGYVAETETSLNVMLQFMSGWQMALAQDCAKI